MLNNISTSKNRWLVRSKIIIIKRLMYKEGWLGRTDLLLPSLSKRRLDRWKRIISPKITLRKKDGKTDLENGLGKPYYFHLYQRGGERRDSGKGQSGMNQPEETDTTKKRKPTTEWSQSTTNDNKKYSNVFYLIPLFPTMNYIVQNQHKDMYCHILEYHQML